MDVWSLLGLEPTRDVSAIRRAYAQQARGCHPEENPEGFLRLREAYQSALAWAQSGPVSPAPAVEASSEPEAPQGWTIPQEPPDCGPNPFADHEAIRQFLALYTGGQRKNSKAWLDYVTSPAFLIAAWDRQFTALLLEHITRLEPELPPSREFLAWLYAAYQFSGRKDEYLDRTEIRFHKYEGADFDGMDSILQIALKGPIPKRAAGNELAILTSFQEYRRLLRLAEQGDWGEPAEAEFSRIIGCYTLSSLQDKFQPRDALDCQRHPAGLRLITHFFQTAALPEELYHIAWQKLDLKSAVMGRAKVLYGGLRDIILERVPHIISETPDRFFQLRKDFTPYAVSCYHADFIDCEEDKARTDAFFAREDFQRALLNRSFIEEDILHTWVDEDRCGYYLERIIDFYTQRPDAPYAETVIQRARQMLTVRAQRRRIGEDREAPVGPLLLSFRPFFRHWLNTGFYLARSPESGRPLSAYLTEQMPFLPQWSRRFLGVEEGEIPQPRIVSLTVAGVPVEVRLHLRYIDYLVNGEAALQPFLEWSELIQIPDPEEFFLLLPAAAASYASYEEVKGALLARLAATAAPEEDRPEIAACLAGQVCRLPLREDGSLVPPEEVLPLEWFMEDGARLLGCSWSPAERALSFFEQTASGRWLQRDGVYEDLDTLQMAEDMARQLLEDAVSPTGLHLELLVNLPTAVYIQPDFSAICRNPDFSGSDMPRALLGAEVTRAGLEELFAFFSAGWISRLELSWPTSFPAEETPEYEPRRSLVFLRERSLWACLYFDDCKAQSFALAARWDRRLREAEDQSVFVPFRQGRLFAHDVHRSFSTIRRHLDTVFQQVSWPNNIGLHSGQIWTSASGVHQGRQKYNLDKLQLGGFPLEWSHSRASARFYLSAYPDLAVWEDEQGARVTLEVGNLNRDQLQQALASFMAGSFAKLRLTWGVPGRQRHAVMLQDQGRFLLAWLSDEKEKAEFHVADVSVYMDVEGKKYPKDTFLGRVTPAYLIHRDVTSLRSALEQLLSMAEDPSPFLNKFAEFAEERPIKPRPYALIRAELTGEDPNP